MNAPGRITGSEVGDYHVLRRVGEGGMGIVYEALNEQINKRVAIKVLKPEAGQADADQEALLAEAQAVNAIGHRNLVGVFGAGKLPDGRRYLVMEYLDGEPLDAYLDRVGPLKPLEACELLMEICGPLHAAHLHGIIHRDLKPGNVFVVRQGDERFLKLLDFGLARRGSTRVIDEAQTRDIVVRGSPDYMAPEQCTNQSVSARTDLYALGSIAYEMLVGKAPFRDDSQPVLEIMMKKVKQRAPALPPSVPPQLAELVSGLLETDPTRRPASADLVRDRLRRIARMLKTGARDVVVTGEKKLAPPPEPPAPVPPTPVPTPPKRSGLALPVGAVVLALVVGSGAWFLLRPAPPHPPVPAPPPVPVVVVEQPPTPPPAAQIDELDLEPQLPTAKRPAAPSVEELWKRLASMEARLGKRTDTPYDAEMLIKQYRVRLTVAKTPAERMQLLREFVAWEKTYLR